MWLVVPMQIVIPMQIGISSQRCGLRWNSARRDSDFRQNDEVLWLVIPIETGISARAGTCAGSQRERFGLSFGMTRFRGSSSRCKSGSLLEAGARAESQRDRFGLSSERQTLLHVRSPAQLASFQVLLSGYSSRRRLPRPNASRIARTRASCIRCLICSPTNPARASSESSTTRAAANARLTNSDCG